MAPHAVDDYTASISTDITNLKAKVVANHVELESSPPPPVADHYMYDFKYNHPLPTVDVLGVDIPKDCDVQEVATTLVARLSDALSSGDADAFAALFLDSGKSITAPILTVTDHCRCLARQACIYLGLSDIQLPTRDSEGCNGSAPIRKSQRS